MTSDRTAVWSFSVLCKHRTLDEGLSRPVKPTYQIQEANGNRKALHHTAATHSEARETGHLEGGAVLGFWKAW